jgi:hypothetical protein
LESDKELAKAKVAEEVKSFTALSQRGENARDTLETATVMRGFANDKDFAKMTGILSNDKISSAVAMLVRDGIGGKNISVGIPAIEDVIRNLNLTVPQQAKYRVFLQTAVQMQLDAEMAMKGSTSDRERLIMGNAKISPQDTAEAVRMKADLLTAKAQFDRRVYKEYNASKMTAKEFLTSDKFEEMHLQHMRKISDLSLGLTQLASPTTKSTAGKPAAKSINLEDAAKRAAKATGD